MIIRKSPAELKLMAKAGAVVAGLHEVLRDALRPGMTTAELDEIAEREVRSRGAIPSFKGYHGFPATLCTSVNDEVVHGIPSPDVVLRAGDLVKIDAGAIVEGYHGDSAATWVVGAAGGAADPELCGAAAAALVERTRAALWQGLVAARDGGRLGDVGSAVEAAVTPYGYGIADGFVGHGIGRALHEGPEVPNRGRAGRGPRLSAGMALAIEPMVNLGGAEVEILDDDWTVVTSDGSLSAHWEHTVAITPDGPWVLTARSDEPAWPLAEPTRVPTAAAATGAAGGSQRGVGRA